MMANRSCFCVGMNMMALFLIIYLLPPTESVTSDDVVPLNFGKNYFPKGFYFGSAISSYQTEGAANKEGRSPSHWDTFTHEFPERIADKSNGDVADYLYEYYIDDIAKMKMMGLNAFRFSISWSRVIPTGKIREGVNELGIQFYNRVINETIKQGMEPFVTIFHWDVPQALEDKYRGFLSPSIIDDFRDFADFCFKKFGDRVKHWITVNEPWTFTRQGYDLGIHAPGRCSSWVSRACLAGNSGTEPYIAAHHLILAHATAVQLYRQNYQEAQRGKIGITLISFWYEPYNEDSYVDRDAAGVALDFMFGWYMDPLTYGEYPRSMQVRVGDRLPKFLERESKLVKGSFDFIGVNYYTGYYASANFTPDPNPTHLRYETDSHVYTTAYKDGIPIGTPTQSSWIYIYPKGIRYLLNYTKDTYRDPTIYITENGLSEYNNKSLTLKEALNDPWRTEYYKEHLWNVLGSIKYYKVNVKGYFAWSFLDNFEWADGYTMRFGLYFVDYKNNLARHPKHSVHWFKKFLNNDMLFDDPDLGGSLASYKLNEDPTLNVVTFYG